MKDLRDFGPVWAASGALNFFGQGWPYHKWFRYLGLTYKGVTFVAKTTTLEARAGNMPLDPYTLMPTELFPKCIYCGPRQWLYGVALNAVGLSGPGARAILGRLATIDPPDPFMISFMAVGKSPELRSFEWSEFLALVAQMPDVLRKKIAIQRNLTCPNVGANFDHDLVGEELKALATAGEFPELENVPILEKLSVVIDTKEAVLISEHSNCDGIVVSNTIPFGHGLWGKIPGTNWRKWFGSSSVSPLHWRGLKESGGLSGAPLLPLVAEWVEEFRAIGGKCYVNAGGGILCPNDVDFLEDAGADSISLGSISFLRPWRMKAVIRRAHELFE